MRAFYLMVAAVVLIVIGVIAYHRHIAKSEQIVPISPNFKLVGVIDLGNIGISIADVKKGEDLLLVLDNSGFTNQFMPAHPELASAYSKPFDLSHYDTAHQGEINNLEPIWQYLYVVIYANDGSSYQVKKLTDVGIHAILTKHLTAGGNHEVLLTDGDTRVLYEMVNLPK